MNSQTRFNITASPRKLISRSLTTRCRLLVAVSTLLLGIHSLRGDIVYISQVHGGEILKVDSAGTRTVFATGLNAVRAVAVDASGNLFVAQTSPAMIFKYDPSGNRSTFSDFFASGGTPLSLAFDAGGNLMVGFNNGVIDKYDPSGTQIPYAAGQLSEIYGLAFDPNGYLYATYIARNSVHVFKPIGHETFVETNKPVGIAVSGNGDVYVTDNSNSVITKFSPNKVGAVFASAGLFNPWGLAFDLSGNLYVANAGGQNVLKYDSAGNSTVFAQDMPGGPGSVAVYPEATPSPSPSPSPSLFETEKLNVQALSGATHSVINDANLSGGAGTQLNATGTGKYVTYTVPVTSGGTYKVKVGVRTGAKRGIFRLSIGGVTQGTAQDEYTSTIGYSVRDLGSVTFFSGGNKPFTFQVTGKNANSGGYSLAFDYIELIPSNRLETETLKVAAKTPPPKGITPAQWFGVFNATAASEGAGTYFNATAPGQLITYTVPVAKAGTYHVQVGVQTKPNKGAFQLAINGVSRGAVQDEYNASVGYAVRDLGTVYLNSGNHAFTFVVAGKDPSSSGYTLAFDYVELVP